MANREKGEVSFEVDGTTYTLAMTMDAMASLEEHFSTPAREMSFEEISAKANAGHVKYVRAFIWAVLQTHHPELRIQDVSPLVQKAGGMAAFAMTLGKLMLSAQPDAKDLEELGIKKPKKNPPQAQGGRRTRGTGGASTSAPAASA